MDFRHIIEQRKVTLHIAQNALQWEWGFASFANGSCCNGICWGLPLRLAQFIKIHFLPHLQSFMWERKFEKKISKKILYNPLMGCSPIQNSRLQIGVTLMGFAEHFGLRPLCVYLTIYVLTSCSFYFWTPGSPFETIIFYFYLLLSSHSREIHTIRVSSYHLCTTKI